MSGDAHSVVAFLLRHFPTGNGVLLFRVLSRACLTCCFTLHGGIAGHIIGDSKFL